MNIMIGKRSIKKTITFDENAYIVKDTRGQEHLVDDINAAQAMDIAVEKYDRLKKYVANMFAEKYLKDVKPGDLIIVSEEKYDYTTKHFLHNLNSVVTIGKYIGLSMDDFDECPNLQIKLKDAWHRGQMMKNPNIRNADKMPFIPNTVKYYRSKLFIPENHDKIRTVVRLANDYERKRYKEMTKEFEYTYEL